MRGIFLSWEKLRVVYNLALVAVVLLVTLPRAATFYASPHFCFQLVEGCVIANVCYFAGPVKEAYVAWLGYRRTASVLRSVLFIAGLVFASLLAVAATAAFLLPNQD